MNRTNWARAFCENVKALRKTHHLSRREMANIMGIKVFTLIQLESGRLPRSLTIDVLPRMANYFGCSVEQLTTPPSHAHD